MDLKLPASISSVEQVEAVIFELEEYADWSRSAGIAASRQLQASDLGRTWSPELQALLAEAMKSREVTLSDTTELTKHLQTIKARAPQLHLALAGWAPTELRQQIVSWARMNLHPQVLINFGVDRTLIGGMVVRAGSHIFDYSWREQLLAGRHLIPEIVRRV